jgi:phosphate acyltransferase
LVHASEVLTMEDKPVAAIRRKKDCSLVRSIDLIRDGRVDAVVSPGNTGGLVAASPCGFGRCRGSIGAASPQ